MKKRIFAVLLTVCLVFTMTVPVFANEKELPPSYYRINVNFADIPGYSESADFMIPADNSGVYINAEHMASLTGRYTYNQTYQQCAFADEASGHAVLFKFNDKDVAVYLFESCLSYTAPMETKYINGVTWIPFDFAATLLNCDYFISDDELNFTQSEYNSLTAIAALMKEENALAFDWVDEVGYSRFNTFIMSQSAGTVNFFQGLFTGDTWGALLNSITNLSGLYDKEYTEDVADLFVAPSQDEMKAFAGYASNAAELKKFFSSTTDTAEVFEKYAAPKVDVTAKDLAKILKDLQKSKPGLAKSEKFTSLIKSVEKVGDKVNSATGLAKQFSEAAEFDFKNKAGVMGDALPNFVDVFAYFLAICSYYEKFTNADDTAIAALKRYAKESELSESEFFTDYANDMQTPWIGAFDRYLSENASSLVVDAVEAPAQALLGPSAFLTIGWNLATSYVPYLKNSLDSTKNFTLSEYGMDFQEESFTMLEDSISECFESSSVNKSGLEDLAMDAYTYLKFSSVARGAACSCMSSSEALDDATKKTITDNMTYMNEKIGEYIVNIGEMDFGPMPGSYLNSGDLMLRKFLETKGERISGSYMSTVPVMEICPFPGDEEDAITEEEAVALVHEVLSGYTMGLMDSFLAGVYEFECIDYYLVDGEIPSYVIQMTTGGNVESSLFFVPYYGDVVWMGSYSSDGYYCYTGLDLNDMSLGSIFTSISDLTEQIIAEANK